MTFLGSLLILFLTVTGAQYRYHGQAVLNDARITPGATSSVTARILCSAAFHTRDERAVDLSTKKKVCAAYGQDVTKCPGKGYEIDHLISLELGGSNDRANLWPQPADAPGVIGFHTKDRVENAAHRAVCSGQISLEDAQRQIAADWYAFGLKYGWIE